MAQVEQLKEIAAPLESSDEQSLSEAPDVGVPRMCCIRHGFFTSKHERFSIAQACNIIRPRLPTINIMIYHENQYDAS